MNVRDLLNNVTTETVKYSVYKNSNATKAGEYDAVNKTIPVLKRHFAKVRVTINEKTYEALVGGEYTKYYVKRNDGTEYLSSESINKEFVSILTETEGRREKSKVWNYLHELDSEVEVIEEDVMIDDNIFDDTTSEEAYYSHVSNKEKEYTR